MKIFTHWSIRYKLLSLLLLLGLTTFAVTGTIAYLKYLNGLKQDITTQLTGINRSKAFQIEAYYRTIHNHAESLSDDRMMIGAMREFHDAFLKLNSTPVSSQAVDAVRNDYEQNFYPRMRQLKVARGRFQDYLPVTSAAVQLQYLYIVKNPYPKGQRDKLVNAGDGSEYSRVHAKY